MRISYDDILSRIKDPPLWWDEYGVPRFNEFRPEDAAGGIYASEVALVRIQCAACKESFMVARSYQSIPWREGNDEYRLSREPGNFEYGDPPRAWHAYDDCLGSTMSSDALEVYQFWFRKHDEEWERDPVYEKRLDW